MERIPCPVELVESDCSGNFDAIVIVSTGIDAKHFTSCSCKYLPVLQTYKEVDEAAENEVTVLALSSEAFPVKRLIHSPVGLLDRDYDDVRSFADAANKGIKRALKAGAKRPLLLIPKVSFGYKSHELVTLLGALESLYVPLEVREDIPSKALKAESLGVCICPEEDGKEKIFQLALAVESGRYVCRDIGGSDPERMSAPNVAEYVKNVFAGTSVKVDIVGDETVIQTEYPLLAAVNRAARGIKRHQARVIFLTYEPEGPVDTTLILVGKGVTYDTGGADIKAGGAMAGMHRDKCGAAAVAGFFQVLATLKPKGIKVLGGMSMVRNSVGSDSYVSDEILTSRAGVRIRVGNTDAEGRMAMADVLCHLKEKAVNEKNCFLFTIATLTGHACLAVGDGYSTNEIDPEAHFKYPVVASQYEIVLDNGPAKREKVGVQIQQAGEVLGDMFELSTIRQEDYKFHEGKSEYEDLIQCNNLPSSRTARGHQTPAAFLIMASGLDKHGCNSEKPLKYCHIDIAASSGPFPGVPSAAPVAALSSCFLFGRD